MNCIKCGSDCIATISAKCNDKCFVSYMDKEITDYVPDDMGIGSGDYVEFHYCLHCGQIQDKFPLVVPCWYTDILADEEWED
jgi:hypothetical protein